MSFTLRSPTFSSARRMGRPTTLGNTCSGKLAPEYPHFTNYEMQPRWAHGCPCHHTLCTLHGVPFCRWHGKYTCQVSNSYSPTSITGQCTAAYSYPCTVVDNQSLVCHSCVKVQLLARQAARFELSGGLFWVHAFEADLGFHEKQLFKHHIVNSSVAKSVMKSLNLEHFTREHKPFNIPN